jgi:anti-sigma factor RsiW
MLRARCRDTVRPLLLVQALALAAFPGFGWAATPIEPRQLGDALPLLAASSEAVAMGIQNAQARLAFAALGPTTVMAGNGTTCASALGRRNE